ncbi:MAG: hypothetical protein R2778_14055 [Saprospiraceae bacterium]
MKLFQTCLTVLMLSGFGLQAQDYSGVIQRYMLENRDKLQLVQTDIENWNVSDQYLTRHNQVTHVYLQQTVNGLKIHNAISSVAIQNNEVKSFSSAFHANAAELTNVSPERTYKPRGGIASGKFCRYHDWKSRQPQY